MAAQGPFWFGVIGLAARSRKMGWQGPACGSTPVSTFLVRDHFDDQLAALPASLAAADATTALRIATCVLAND